MFNRFLLQSLRTSCVALLMACGASTAMAQERQLAIMVGGGTQGEGIVKAYIEPFEKETGIKVRVIRDQVSTAKVALQHRTGTIDFDLGGTTPSGAVLLQRRGMLEDIDYSRLDQALMNKLEPSSKEPWGVQIFAYGWVLGIDTSKLPAGAPLPQNWADFWDVKKFPGRRTLQNAELGIQSPLEEALLADGVPMEELYPLDVDRAFRSLDKIKPHIRTWWKQGSEQMQLFRSGGIAMGMGFDGRFTQLIDDGRPIHIVWNQYKRTGLYWVIPKGAKNIAEAHAFISFSNRPERQAEFSRLTGYGPSNPDAFNFIVPEIAKKLSTYPDNMKSSYVMDNDWYTEVGADGKSNAERLTQRWNEWITQ